MFTSVVVFISFVLFLFLFLLILLLLLVGWFLLITFLALVVFTRFGFFRIVNIITVVEQDYDDRPASLNSLHWRMRDAGIWLVHYVFQRTEENVLISLLFLSLFRFP